MKLSSAAVTKSIESLPYHTSKLPVGTVIPTMVAQQFNSSNNGKSGKRVPSVPKAVSMDVSITETHSSGNTAATASARMRRLPMDHWQVLQ